MMASSSSSSSSSSSTFFSLKCLIWDSLSTYFLFLFTLFRTRVFRSKKSNGMKHDAADGSETKLDPVREAGEEDGPRVLMAFNDDDDDDACEDREEPVSGFAFRFQTYEEFHRSRRILEDIDPLPIAFTGKSFCAYLDELEERNRDVGEEEVELEDSTKISESVQEKVVEEDEKSREAEEESVEEGKSCSDSESSTGSVPLTLPLQSCSDGFFLSDRDETQNPAYDDTVMSGSDDQISDRDLNEEIPFTWSSCEEEEEEEEEEDVYTTEELSRIEQTHYRDMESLEPSDNKETILPLSEDFESNGWSESLWEHEELMEQLKTELENVKTKGGRLLPTIEEDSEYSKISEDLKPWKMDQKPKKDSLHKIHITYSERMKKFDMLNFQKMFAMGLVQLTNGSGGNISSSMENRTRPSNWYRRGKKVLNESVLKVMRDLRNDMEVVYVGQLCLSWDFLHLQYKTALQIWQSDARRLSRYCGVAVQFQRFQVLMIHFMEDETFRGPRVEHFAKSRCILRHLLQIPLIREDKRKEEQRVGVVVTSDMLVEIIEECIRIFWRFLKADEDSKYCDRKRLSCMDVPNCSAESDELLTEIRRDIRKWMMILRRENCIVRKLNSMKVFCRKEAQNKDEGEKEEEEDPAVYFLSRVELRLVVRVVNMSGPGLTMERLAWCKTKLNNITFNDRTKTLHLGPSFLLFPA